MTHKHTEDSASLIGHNATCI